jgi:hypothetical protein
MKQYSSPEKIFKGLRRFLEQEFMLPVADGKHLHFKVEYMKLEYVRYNGEMMPALKIAVFLQSGYFNMGGKIKELNDFNREHLNGIDPATIWYISTPIEVFLSEKTQYYNFPIVRVTKIRTLEEK